VLLVNPPRVDGAPFPLTVVRLGPAATTVETSTPFGAGAEWKDCVPSVTLVDGRAVIACTRLERAVYATSSDGVLWSKPVEIRPTGGRFQKVMGMAAEPDGGLFFVIGDAGGPGARAYLPLGVRVAKP